MIQRLKAFLRRWLALDDLELRLAALEGRGFAIGREPDQPAGAHAHQVSRRVPGAHILIFALLLFGGLAHAQNPPGGYTTGGTGLPAGCTSPASAQLKCSIFIDTTSITNVGAAAQALNLYVSGACDGVSACTGNFWGIIAPASMSASIQYTGNPSDVGGGPLQSDAAQHLSVPGDANHSPSPVTTGSGTSIGSTSFCSTANCPAGTYVISTYIDITTACTTTGTYIVNLIYTDDQGSKTVPINIQGTGTTPATGSLALSSTANFGQATQVIHTTGAASLNYSTTATACGTGGPMVGKLYLSTLRVGN